jgi:hypothetical protein
MHFNDGNDELWQRQHRLQRIVGVVVLAWAKCPNMRFQDFSSSRTLSVGLDVP